VKNIISKAYQRINKAEWKEMDEDFRLRKVLPTEIVSGAKCHKAYHH